MLNRLAKVVKRKRLVHHQGIYVAPEPQVLRILCKFKSLIEVALSGTMLLAIVRANACQSDEGTHSPPQLGSDAVTMTTRKERQRILAQEALKPNPGRQSAR